MKHLKTFESFKTNETMDMMFMPVDPIKGAADVYADAYDDIKSYVKGKIEQFEEKVEEVADAIIEKLDVKKTINQVESYFGKNIDELTYEDIKLKLAKANESFIDRYDAVDPYGGDSEGLDTSFNDVKGGVAQKILSLLQKVFAINLLSFGLGGSLIASLAGFLVGPGASMFISIGAFIVLHIIRKLIAMSEN